MSNEKLDKTNVIESDTLKIRLDEAKKAPPAIVLLSGPSGIMGKSWSLEKDQMTIGRDLTCDIQMEEKGLSKKHAMLSVSTDSLVTITDLGSTNGTEVSSVRLEPNAPLLLNNNDRVKLGNVIFKFLSQGNIESLTAASLYDKSTLDGLTQILNKQAVMGQLDDAFKKAKLTETNLSVIVFDLDFFKKVNDSYGHQAGDYVLRELSSVVKNQLIRSGDSFGRYGGEEFVIVLFGSPLQRSCEIAERIRTTVERHHFEFDQKTLSITVSLGVACIDPSMTAPGQLFAKADQAAYVSKNAGRNRVSTI